MQDMQYHYVTKVDSEGIVAKRFNETMSEVLSCFQYHVYYQQEYGAGQKRCQFQLRSAIGITKHKEQISLCHL